MKVLLVVVVVIAAGALATAGLALTVGPSAPAASAATELVATVGPGHSISLETADGSAVKQLDPGAYTITVHDRASEHNFHLLGPGVDRKTDVSGTGSVTWNLTLKDGVYNFFCDPHASTLRGSFKVGNPPSSPSPAAKPAAAKLLATVGPSATITLTRGGKKVTALKAGAYTIAVRDRSSFHNFRLIGPGLNRATTVSFTGTKTWKVTLRKGVYRFRCDPHRSDMKGSFRVS